MSKILVGGISEEGNRLLNVYIDKFLPNVTIEPLRAAGIKGKIKNHAKRSDVILVVIEDALYQMCVGVADEVLSLPKVHRYVDDEGFKQFLISKFGKLDNITDVNNQSKAMETGYTLPVSDVSVTQTVNTKSVQSKIVEEEFKDSFIIHEDNSEVERNLRAELSTRDMMIENLKRQIKELMAENETDDDDYTILRNRIAELEVALAEKTKEIEDSATKSYAELGKVARAEQVLQDMEELKKSLNKSREDVSVLTYEKEQLLTQVSNTKKAAEDAQIDLERLKEVEKDFITLSEKHQDISGKYEECVKNLDDIERGKTSLEVKVLELNQTVAKLQLDLADKGVLEARITELTEKNSKYKDTITELEDKVSDFNEVSIRESNLTVDLATVKEEKRVLEEKVELIKGELQTKEEEYATLLEKLNSSSNEIKSKEDLVSTLSSQISELKTEISSKVEEISSLQTKVFSLEKDVNTRNTLIASANETIESLQKSVSSSNQGVSESEEKIADLQNSLSESNTKVSNLEFELDKVKAELSQVRARKESVESQLFSLKESISSSSNELENLTKSLSDKNAEIVNLMSEISTYKKQLDDKEVELSGKSSEILNLTGQIRKLESEISILKTNSQENNEQELKEFVKRNEELEGQITDLKRSIAKLESENDTLNVDLKEARDTSEKDTEIENLRIEVNKLQEDLRVKSEQVKSGVDPQRLKELEIELEAVREKSARLECDLLDKDEQLNEINENIFVKMADYSLPKITVPLSVPMPVNGYDRMYTFASGSAESCVSTYQLIKKIVSSNSDINYLIVDLVTDTYIDRELGVRGIKSPTLWLQGSDSVDDYIAMTKFDNVKVISTALAYFNDLFLLNVNWKKRLDEISTKADVIILNVGSLDNIIHNTLFNSFTSILKGNIIVKATPINLRTAYLHLSGLSQLKNTNVYCINIEEQSKQLYQKLASKFPTQILRESDVLNL